MNGNNSGGGGGGAKLKTPNPGATHALKGNTLAPSASRAYLKPNASSRERSISPSTYSIPVHQDFPGSRSESVLANHLYWIQRCAKEESMKLKSLSTGIQLGFMKHISQADAEEVVNQDEIVEENARRDGKVLKVKKRNIINKLNQKLSTIRVSPQRNEQERNYSTLVDQQMQASRRTDQNETVSAQRNENYSISPVRPLDLNHLGKGNNGQFTPNHALGYQPISYSPPIPPPANFLGMELPLPKKEGRVHFMTKSHIDLSFPEIKTISQVRIESSRNKMNGALAPATTQINNQSYKPPLHSTNGKNDMKVQNQHLDNNTALYQFKVNQKLAKKVNIHSNLSTVFQGPDYSSAKILRKFDSHAAQDAVIQHLQKPLQSKEMESQSGNRVHNSSGRSMSGARGGNELTKSVNAGNGKFKLPKMTKMNNGRSQQVASSVQALPSIKILENYNASQDNYEQGGTRDASPELAANRGNGQFARSNPEDLLALPGALRKSVLNNPLAQSLDANNGNFKLPPMMAGNGSNSGVASKQKGSRNNSSYLKQINTQNMATADNSGPADDLVHVDKSLNNMLTETLKNRKSQIRLY